MKDICAIQKVDRLGLHALASAVVGTLGNDIRSVNTRKESRETIFLKKPS